MVSHLNSSSRPDPLVAKSDLTSTTAALHRMSVDPVASAVPTDVKGKKSAAAVVVEFAHQPTPPPGRVVLPLGPGHGRMLTVWAEYACHRCASDFATMAFR